MVKTLTDRFKISKTNRGKKLGLLGAALFNLGTLMGCPSPVEYEKPEPVNPTAKLIVSPTEGTSPLESVLYLDCDDADGKVTKSYVFADYDGDGKMDSGEELALTNSGSINQNYTFTKSGTFNVYGQCEDEQGNIGKSSPVPVTVQPKIIDPDKKYTISGNLQDNETDSNQIGDVKLYVNGTETSVDRDGDFSFEVPENSNVKLKGTIKNGSSIRSYTRTLNLGHVNEDKEGINLRCVPYNALETDSLDATGREEDFKEHMRRVNFGDNVYITPSPEPGSCYIKKSNIQNIEIDPDNWSNGGFSVEQVETAIRNSKYVNATNLIIEIGKNHINQERWGRVIYGDPNSSDENYPPYTIVHDFAQDGYIDSFETYLNTTDADVVNHEIFHGLLFPGHSAEEGEIEYFPSLMTWTGSTSPAKAVDIKANYIIDEPTYLGMESIDDILGSN